MSVYVALTKTNSYQLVDMAINSESWIFLNLESFGRTSVCLINKYLANVISTKASSFELHCYGNSCKSKYKCIHILLWNKK